ncbi:MAG: hypothetical protein ABFS23_05715 [Pseudomonadota bacterium]
MLVLLSALLVIVPVPVLSVEALTVRPLQPDYRFNPDQSVTLRVCFNWSCSNTEDLTFSQAELAAVARQMSLCKGNRLHDRLQRARIGVWQMEKLAQKHLPVLSNDRAINDWDEHANGRTDCVDNATNTTNFLHVLEDLELLPGWSVTEPRVRDRFDFGLVHWTAVLTDENNSQPWSVDSWFRPHGHLPYVMPLSDWSKSVKGWEPPFDAQNPYPSYVDELCPSVKLSQM